MTIIKRFTYAIAAFAAAFSLTCCQEPAPPAEEGVLFANEFVLNGTASSIGSAVRFDQDNNTIQFWLSPSSGLTTADEIENAGGHIVISTHKSFIGSRDRFTKAGSFVRSGDSLHALLALCNDRMSGIGATLIAHHEIRLVGKNVNNLALAFIPPLGTDQNRIHLFLKPLLAVLLAQLVKLT